MNVLTALMRDDGLRARMFRGTFWTGLNHGGQNFIRLAGNLALTRILFPEAFGLMALVQVVITALNMFSDLGIGASVVQDKRGDDPRFLDTAFVVQIARGVVLWLLTCAAAGPVASFYDAPVLADILPVTGLVALIQGFNSTKIYTAGRAITLGRITLLYLGAQTVGLLVTIALALAWASVWALVIGGLLAPLIVAVLSHILLPGHRNRLRFEWAAARRLVGFGKYIFLATVAGFFVNQADRAILGKFISLEQIAIYNIGLLFALVVYQLGLALSQNVIFPLNARLPTSESAANRRKTNRARRALTGLLISGSGLMALVGDPLVVFLYDPRYEAAGPITSLVALTYLPVMITMTYHSLPLAAGESGRFALMVTSLAVLQTAAILTGIHLFGIGGAAVAPAVAAALFYPFLARLSSRYKGWDPLHDAGYAVLALIIAGLVFLLHGDALAPLFAPL